MEKSVSVADEKSKVINNLHVHNDLALFILSKLPLKSLKRFGCVRKAWSLLFENSHFMNMLRNHFLFNNRSDHSDSHTFLILEEHPFFSLRVRYVYQSSIYLLSSSDRFENGIELDLPPPFQEDDTNIFVLSSINGILCIGQEKIRGMVHVLWNPSTTEFTVIPTSPKESAPPYQHPSFEFHGFGYDRVKDDYKVIRYTSFSHVYEYDEDEGVSYKVISYDPLFEVFSLRSNSWSILDVDVPSVHYKLRPGMYTDGVCHWWSKSSSHDVEDCLVSFDFSNELFFTTPMLLDVDESCDYYSIERCLVVLNESIALISNCPDATTFHISILSELGVKKS